MKIANEPAFPDSLGVGKNNPGHSFRGLTKREYFAAKAMEGEMASQEKGSFVANYEELAKQSMEIADALIKELEK